MTEQGTIFPSLNIERLKLFLALSRTPHGLLDMATPGFSVLLYLGGFPPIGTLLIGLITAFAGYTAIYALNDLVDYRTDKAKSRETGATPENYLDSLMVRHPMAQGLLTYKEGLVWVLGWSLVALVGAYWLNPVCVVIFVAGALLEAVYCLMWRVSPWRSVVSGFVKNSGPVAALFAVDPSPSPLFTLLIFLALFFWEIGGQNIPADWTDVDLDKRFKAKTIPIRLGKERSARLGLAALTAACVLTGALLVSRFPSPLWITLLLASVSGAVLLLIPGYNLYASKTRQDAISLFNRASYFPLSLLVVTLVLLLLKP
jgi:4-hydroxybenzoate polyprenyltransferase